MASITLYDDKNLKGTNYTATESVPKIKYDRMHDNVSSIEVGSGKWVLYKDDNYHKFQTVINKGQYFHNNDKNYAWQNDALDSVRLLPSSGIAVFKDSNFEGDMLVFDANIDDFNGIDFNDEISSIIVISGRWGIYKNRGFDTELATLSTSSSELNSAQVHLGLYPDSDSWGGGNDSISSLRRLS